MSEARGRRPAEAPPRSPRQARMGPAPFASFEESFDEVRQKGDSPDEKPIIRLPDISEDDISSRAGPPSQGGQAEQQQQQQQAPQEPAMENLAPAATGNLQTPSTPRIDISRASSSSHHDSRDSSPENAIFGISDSIQDVEGAKLGLGFREDGTADLRSSTEELAFLEPNAAAGEKESSKQPSSRRSPLMFKPEDHHRKDSQCSDIVLLSISGRTSRLSSIGSQGSAHSNVSAHSNMSHISAHSNVSHISGQSRLSVISGISRSPSPHKMILETSFCGPKPLENDVGVVGADKHHSEVLEQVLLSRKHDPKDAIVAEGISISKPKETVTPSLGAKPALPERRNPPPPVETKESNGKAHHAEPPRKKSITSPVISVSTLGASYKSETKPQPKVTKAEPPAKSKQVYSSTAKKNAQSKPTKTTSSSGETEYIRIKLKPDHMYDDDYDSSSQQEMQKPITLNLSEHSKKNAPQHFSQLVKREDSLNKITYESTDVQISSAHTEKSSSHSQSSSIAAAASPKQTKHVGLRDNGSRTPSPPGKTPSRKSSFCSLFKSRETIASPESPTGSVSKRKGLTGIIKDTTGSIHSSRSRSKSRERDKSGGGTPTSAGKSKGSVLAIFKPSRKSSASSSPVARENLPNLDGIHSVDYKHSAETRSAQNLRQTQKERLKYYDAPVDGFIRIPLHTPSDEDKPPPREPEKKAVAVPPPKAPPRHDDDAIQVMRSADRPVSAPSSSRPSFSHPSKKQDPASKQIILPDGSIRIPLHSPSEDRLVRCDLMSEEEKEEIKRRCSNISTKKNGTLDRNSAGSGVSSSTDVSSKIEEKVIIECDKKKLPEPIILSEPAVEELPAVVEQQVEVQIEERPSEENLSSQAKKHIIFTTKVGSKDQLFSLQFSLSKTDSQCSQMSDNRSQISEESVIEVPLADRRVEEPVQRSPSIESKSEKRCSRSISESRNQSIEPICTHAPEKSEPVVESIEPTIEPTISRQNATTIEEPSPPTHRIQAALIKSDTVESRSSVMSAEDMHDSSESERDSELDFIRKKQLLALEKAKEKTGKTDPVEVDHERKNLMLQQESFDDELPYIPTTLPQERSVALPIVPIKQRQTIEMRTCPIDRPRSTTPIAPSCLEEYCSDEVYTPDTVKAERLKISLPLCSKNESEDKTKAKQKAKSPRRISAGSNPKTWFEFAEQGISKTAPRKSSTGQESDSDPAPPLPPRAPVAKTQQWINFENIPERRKVPKRIQTIPSRTNVEVAAEPNVVYTYVNPEDCKCECHESGKDTGEDMTPEKEEDEEPLLDDSGEAEGLSAPPIESVVRRKADKRHVAGESQGYYSHRPTMGTPRIGVAFSRDASSNRSSVASQDADRSSSSGSPNDVPPRRPPRSP